MKDTSAKDEYDFLQFLADHTSDRDVLSRTLTMIAKYVAIYTGDDPYPLADASELDAEEYRRAISVGLKTRVDRVKFVSIAELEEAGGCKYMLDDFVTTSMLSMNINRYDDLNPSLGMEGAAQVIENLEQKITLPVIFTLLGSYMDFFRSFDEKSQVDIHISSTPSAFLHYMYWYAILGNSQGFGEMEPLVELAMGAVPIGEPWSEIGTWLVLTA